MKKFIFVLPLLFVVILIIILIPLKRNSQSENIPENRNEIPDSQSSTNEKKTSLANPASAYCEENGGKLEIVTNSDGSQFGMCQFEDHACEEWAYMNGECTIEEDAEKIKQALIDKGLNLTGMKVVIDKHLGEYIGGGVVPVSAPAGGGYVFAVKEGEEIKVLADGNGAIMCSAFEEYPDYPSYLVSECIDEAGNIVTR